MNVAVVVPTYNERDNIDSLLEALLALPVPDLSVLVVDDSSPDGTGALVREWEARDPRIRLLSQPRRGGYGHACTAAFEALLRHPSPPEVIVQMDADWSHHPADVPRLLHALTGADLAIGSRYVPGGGTEHWGRGRRVLSRGANAYARLLTGVHIHDLTGGFNAWRTSLLSAISPRTIQTEGYGYLIELKVRAARSGTKIAEVPITFVERRTGQSKLSKRVIWEAAGVVLRLAVRRP